MFPIVFYKDVTLSLCLRIKNRQSVFKVFKHYWCYVMWCIFFSMNWIKNSKHICLIIFATLPINRTYLPFAKVISPTQQVNVTCECFLIQTHKSSSKPQKNSHNLNLRSKTYYLLPFECKTKFNILFIFCWIKMKLLCSNPLYDVGT